MKKRDIITLVIAGIVLLASIYFIVQLIFPGKPKETKDKGSSLQTVEEVPQNIDSTVFQTISTLSDYGKPNLDNIGKTDLFAGF